MERESLATRVEKVVGELGLGAGAELVSMSAELTAANAKVGQLETAVERRTVLGQATGWVMVRYGLTASAAFQVLVQLSQDTNRKVHDIASEIVQTHDAEAIAAQAEERPLNAT